MENQFVPLYEQKNDDVNDKNFEFKYNAYGSKFGKPIALFSKKTRQPLIVFEVLFQDTFAYHRGDEIFITELPTLSEESKKRQSFQIVSTADNEKIKFDVTNLCDDTVNFNLMRAGVLINEINVLRASQSYSIKSDASNGNKVLMFKSFVSKSGEGVVLRDELGGPAEKKVGSYLDISVLPKVGSVSLNELFEETFWKPIDFFVVRARISKFRWSPPVPLLHQTEGYAWRAPGGDVAVPASGPVDGFRPAAIGYSAGARFSAPSPAAASWAAPASSTWGASGAAAASAPSRAPIAWAPAAAGAWGAMGEAFSAPSPAPSAATWGTATAGGWPAAAPAPSPAPATWGAPASAPWGASGAAFSAPSPVAATWGTSSAGVWPAAAAGGWPASAPAPATSWAATPPPTAIGAAFSAPSIPETKIMDSKVGNIVTGDEIIAIHSQTVYEDFNSDNGSNVCTFGISLMPSLKIKKISPDETIIQIKSLIASYIDKSVLHLLTQMKIYKDPTCCICLTETPNGTYYRCGHKCTCIADGKDLALCPICRAPVIAYVSDPI
ncbi:MAG: hypothetical protein Hyperionvirus26_20 [Hyperionvirus sp.]|uniref:RING-type domain-containing protein n=1 Tax=Hyperionvirus sp. TaxID=2487770 RepID=A0A3G5AB46_9VIRU|nr:MAG: hypothetical protein Hyperionvirus26_20 [Hyperionvirus sp.]